MPRIEEYYPNAIKETYVGKSGYTYTCKEPKEYTNPTNIYCAVVTKEEVDVEYIEDVYQKILEYEKEGILEIKRYGDTSREYIKRIEGYLIDDIEKYNLRNSLDNNYAIFLKAKFPRLFNN